MKRIAILIDGTWNQPYALEPTNVIRLSRCIFGTDADDNQQTVIYSPGVGSGTGNNALARRLDRLLGGAFGWGLTDIIEDTYRNLVFAYEPGDELYIFGFSRGAFAARSLAGLIRSCGIPPRRHLARIPEAMARYIAHTPETHPEHPTSYEFRADFAPETATSAGEYTWRRKRGDEAIKLTISYLGVWDTVNALGLPSFVPMSDAFNQQYRFHDTKLSSMVLAARHAMSIDERRATFPAHPWSNLDELNEAYEAQTSPIYLQQWFPGDHGSVGGGGARVGLSSIAFNWVAMGAEQAGLRLNWEEFDRLAWRFDPEEALVNKIGPVGLSGAVLNALKTDRTGPADLSDLSLAALDRFRKDGGYRPKTLDGVYDQLYALSDKEWGDQRGRMIARDGGPTHDLGSFARPRRG